MASENRILAILVLGTLMGALDTTIVLLAIPTITQSLHTSLVTTIWTIVAYLLVLAVATTQVGRLGDIYGRSRIFNIGFVIFTVGSLMCGLAPNGASLVGFRVVQALGGAMLEATSGAIIADTFERHRRGRAYGYTALGWNAGALLGIVLGGIITTFIGWRFIFLVNIPIGIVAAVLGFAYLKDANRSKERLDIGGMAALGTALGLISYGLLEFAAEGASALNMISIAVGALLLPIFVYIETNVANPMVDMRLFANRVLRYSLSASFLQALGFLSITFLIIMYLQGVRGLDPFRAALLLAPGYVVSLVLAPRMGRLSDKAGARIVATAGIVLSGITVAIYMTIGLSTSLYLILAAAMVSGAGSAMFWPANSSAVMAHAAADRHGSISGLLRTLTSIGILGSYVISITAAAAAVSRSTAFEIFIGTSKIIGGVSKQFIGGLHAAFALSLIILAAAGVLSSLRGKEDRKGRLHSAGAHDGS